jgi:hypothetical protein
MLNINIYIDETPTKFPTISQSPPPALVSSNLPNQKLKIEKLKKIVPALQE